MSDIIIVQYDRNFNELRRDPLDQAPGIASGIRDDARAGWITGIRPNWCMSAIPDSCYLEIIHPSPFKS